MFVIATGTRVMRIDPNSCTITDSREYQGGIASMAVTGMGTVVGMDDGRVYLNDFYGEPSLLFTDDDRITSVSRLHQSQGFVYTCGDRLVMFDGTSTRLTEDIDRVRGSSVSVDDSTIVCHNDEYAVVVKSENGVIREDVLDHPGSWRVEVSPDGLRMIITDDDDFTCVDIRTNDTRTIEVQNALATCSCYSPDGSIIALGGTSAFVSLVDANTLAPLSLLSDSMSTLIGDEEIWNEDDPRVPIEIMNVDGDYDLDVQVDYVVDYLKFSDDSSVLASVLAKGRVTFWNLNTSTEFGSVEVNERCVGLDFVSEIVLL
jgi:WD40 repeat protein